MRILDVVDRVVVRLLLGEVEVKVELAVERAHEEEIACGICADFFHELIQRDALARALAHLDELAPDVDEAVKAALVLVVVVGDVGREVRRHAVVADDDAVLVVAVRRRLEPEGTVLLVDVALLLEDLDDLAHRIRVERALAEPLVALPH